MIALYDVIVRSAGAGLDFQGTEGSMPPGHNGPWNTPETPVRNTAHWALTFYKAFNISNDERFLRAALGCCDYLVREENRPFGKTFYCRTQAGAKSNSNGLIGQAWAIEPLLLIGSDFLDRPYLEVAETVLSFHPYDESKHGWMAVEIDGTELGVSRTLNHHVWFAAMALLANIKNPRSRNDVLDFIRHLPQKIRFIEPGIISHRFPAAVSGRKTLLAWIAGPKDPLWPSLKTLSTGYQSFLLYGLALALAYSKAIDVLGETLSRIIAESVKFMLNGFPFTAAKKNPFAWSYNPVGIEMAYVLENLEPRLPFNLPPTATPSDWLCQQFSRHFDPRTQLMEKNTFDPLTLAARIYEATRLTNYALTLDATADGQLRCKAT